MGVHNLWKILDPVKKPVKIESLKGQTLAVDLSVWICDAQGVKQMQGHVAKPHLRNLFFRVSYLLQLGVKLIFVVDGEAPEVKWEAMIMRQQARYGYTSAQSKKTMRKPGRANFKRLVNEACQMLEYLGIPYVQSVGEAEAFCALLNKEGVADCVVTQDGDAFLYGATKVYRNFTINTKESDIECYSLVDIESQLNLNKDKLIALGLLLGCDYVPKGVPGVGKETAMKFMMEHNTTESVLQKFRDWRNPASSSYHMKVPAIEAKIKSKALEVANFPFEKVIKEFMVVKDRCPKQRLEWKKPRIDKLYEFNEKLEWPTSYTNEKVIPLMTLYDMRRKAKHPDHQPEPRPERIVKARVRQFVPCFEVQWEKLDYDTDPENTQAFYTTFEERDLFTLCYPDVVSTFELNSKKPSKAERKSRKNKGECSGQKETSDYLIKNLAPALAHLHIDANLNMDRPVGYNAGHSEERDHDVKFYDSEMVTSAGTDCMSSAVESCVASEYWEFSSSGSTWKPNKTDGTAKSMSLAKIRKGSADRTADGHSQIRKGSDLVNTDFLSFVSRSGSLSEKGAASDPSEPEDLITRLRRLRLAEEAKTSKSAEIGSTQMTPASGTSKMIDIDDGAGLVSSGNVNSYVSLENTSGVPLEKTKELPALAVEGGSSCPLKNTAHHTSQKSTCRQMKMSSNSKTTQPELQQFEVKSDTRVYQSKMCSPLSLREHLTASLVTVQTRVQSEVKNADSVEFSSHLRTGKVDFDEGSFRSVSDSLLIRECGDLEVQAESTVHSCSLQSLSDSQLVREIAASEMHSFDTKSEFESDKNMNANFQSKNYLPVTEPNGANSSFSFQSLNDSELVTVGKKTEVGISENLSEVQEEFSDWTDNSVTKDVGNVPGQKEEIMSEQKNRNVKTTVSCGDKISELGSKEQVAKGEPYSLKYSAFSESEKSCDTQHAIGESLSAWHQYKMGNAKLVDQGTTSTGPCGTDNLSSSGRTCRMNTESLEKDKKLGSRCSDGVGLDTESDIGVAGSEICKSSVHDCKSVTPKTSSDESSSQYDLKTEEISTADDDLVKSINTSDGTVQNTKAEFSYSQRKENPCGQNFDVRIQTGMHRESENLCGENFDVRIQTGMHGESENSCGENVDVRIKTGMHGESENSCGENFDVRIQTRMPQKSSVPGYVLMSEKEFNQMKQELLTPKTCNNGRDLQFLESTLQSGYVKNEPKFNSVNLFGCITEPTGLCTTEKTCTLHFDAEDKSLTQKVGSVDLVGFGTDRSEHCTSNKQSGYPRDNSYLNVNSTFPENSASKQKRCPGFQVHVSESIDQCSTTVSDKIQRELATPKISGSGTALKSLSSPRPGSEFCTLNSRPLECTPNNAMIEASLIPKVKALRSDVNNSESEFKCKSHESPTFLRQNRIKQEVFSPNVCSSEKSNLSGRKLEDLVTDRTSESTPVQEFIGYVKREPVTPHLNSFTTVCHSVQSSGQHRESVTSPKDEAMALTQKTMYIKPEPVTPKASSLYQSGQLRLADRSRRKEAACQTVYIKPEPVTPRISSSTSCHSSQLRLAEEIGNIKHVPVTPLTASQTVCHTVRSDNRNIMNMKTDAPITRTDARLPSEEIRIKQEPVTPLAASETVCRTVKSNNQLKKSDAPITMRTAAKSTPAHEIIHIKHEPFKSQASSTVSHSAQCSSRDPNTAILSTSSLGTVRSSVRCGADNAVAYREKEAAKLKLTGYFKDPLSSQNCSILNEISEPCKSVCSYPDTDSLHTAVSKAEPLTQSFTTCKFHLQNQARGNGSVDSPEDYYPEIKDRKPQQLGQMSSGKHLKYEPIENFPRRSTRINQRNIKEESNKSEIYFNTSQQEKVSACTCSCSESENDGQPLRSVGEGVCHMKTGQAVFRSKICSDYNGIKSVHSCAEMHSYHSARNVVPIHDEQQVELEHNGTCTELEHDGNHIESEHNGTHIESEHNGTHIESEHNGTHIESEHNENHTELAHNGNHIELVHGGYYTEIGNHKESVHNGNHIRSNHNESVHNGNCGESEQNRNHIESIHNGNHDESLHNKNGTKSFHNDTRTFSSEQEVSSLIKYELSCSVSERTLPLVYSCVNTDESSEMSRPSSVSEAEENSKLIFSNELDDIISAGPEMGSVPNTPLRDLVPLQNMDAGSPALNNGNKNCRYGCGRCLDGLEPPTGSDPTDSCLDAELAMLLEMIGQRKPKKPAKGRRRKTKKKKQKPDVLWNTIQSKLKSNDTHSASILVNGLEEQEIEELLIAARAPTPRGSRSRNDRSRFRGCQVDCQMTSQAVEGFQHAEKENLLGEVETLCACGIKKAPFAGSDRDVHSSAQNFEDDSLMMLLRTPQRCENSTVTNILALLNSEKKDVKGPPQPRKGKNDEDDSLMMLLQTPQRCENSTVTDILALLNSGKKATDKAIQLRKGENVQDDSLMMLLPTPPRCENSTVTDILDLLNSGKKVQPIQPKKGKKGRKKKKAPPPAMTFDDHTDSMDTREKLRKRVQAQTTALENHP